MRAQARMNSHKINKKTWHRQALPLKNAHLCRVNSFRFPEACITLIPHQPPVHMRGSSPQ